MFLKSHLEKFTILTRKHTGERKLKKEQDIFTMETKADGRKRDGHRDSLYRVGRGGGMKLERYSFANACPSWTLNKRYLLLEEMFKKPAGHTLIVF